ncbi:hypothetical protein [Chitinophaga sp. RAB17]|uniref:hypothetical protein n=1 Tax=Chitinophaga sp. RAB17 TaxID=3233049 RepID=UPI003F92CDCE
MRNDKMILAGFLAATIFLACNSPMQNKKEQAAHDSANAPPKSPDTGELKTMQRDTTYGDYRISIITRGNGYMRDLVLAIGSKKDTTAADSITEKDIKGQLKDVMLADLDGNGQPEIYFAMLSEGTGKYGKIYAFDLRRPVSRINTNSIDTMQQVAYRGQDTFYIKGKNLVRTFPAFREGDPDALTANTKGIILYDLRKEKDTLKLLPVK